MKQWRRAGFDETHPAELALFGQELFHDAEEAPPLTDPGNLDQRRTAIVLTRRSIDEVLAAHRLDGFAGPLPIGTSFIGGHRTDEALLRFAAAFENAAQARRAPAYLPTMP